MTLIVACGRADEWALTSCDSTIFYQGEDTQWMPDDDRDAGKVVRLTDRVLLACCGDSFIGEDLKRLMAERVAANDDLETCRRVAQEAVRELWAADRPGQVERHNGRLFTRGSVKKERGFGFVLNGFKRDGHTGVVTYRGGQRKVDPIVSNPDTIQGVVIPCYGLDDGAVEQLSRIGIHLLANALDESLSLRGAARRAINVHRFVGTHYEDRTTPDVNFTIVRRSNDGYVLLEFSVDWADEAGFETIYDELAGLALSRATST
jgi:hypothetical protein